MTLPNSATGGLQFVIVVIPDHTRILFKSNCTVFFVTWSSYTLLQGFSLSWSVNLAPTYMKKT